MNGNEKNIPKIIIVDDHLIFRQGLKALLDGEKIAQVVGEASNGKEFINLLHDSNPDLVLMDIEMPHMNGIEASKTALELFPDIKIIVFSMFGDEEYYQKMINIGVKGFIQKSSGIYELEKAIHEVYSGECYFSNELLRKIISSIGHKNEKGTAAKTLFTAREMQVLEEIVAGNTNEEIASHLFISSKTVKSHRSKLLEKSGCKNTAELIVYAIKSKLVNL